MNAQILVNFGKNWFEFTKSKTGQLDFAGKVDAKNVNVEGFQKLSGSSYFSPSYYIFLEDELNATPEIFVAQGTDISDKDTFDFLLHVGALLGAVEAKDSLLAGELYFRRRTSFEKFSKLTEFIIEPIAAEMLFSLVFGRWNNVEEDEIPLLFNIAKRKIKIDSSREDLAQAFTRYFKENETSLTLPVVGNNHHSWNEESKILNLIPQNYNASDFLMEAEKFKAAKHIFYSNLKVSVQAEPYNPADKNAIAVMIEDIDSKLSGNGGLKKAGYIRATAAEILREAKEEKISYGGKLVRLSRREIVVRVNV